MMSPDFFPDSGKQGAATDIACHIPLRMWNLFPTAAIGLTFAARLLAGQILVSTVQAGRTVTASSADAFVDSIGVTTHWGYPNTPYGMRYRALKLALLSASIRHIRDGATSQAAISQFKDLASSGIKTTYLLSPDQGVVPTTAYWVNKPGCLLPDFLKSVVGLGVVDAVEMPNELDEFYERLHWLRGEAAPLSGERNSPKYWAAYAVAITKDSWAVLRSDPDLADIRLIGPSLGRTANGFPSQSMYDFVDWGNFHPYPYGGNSFSYPLSYDSTDKYFWHSNQPTVNIDQYPFAFQTSEKAFSDGPFKKPMAATETGYFTGTAEKSISETTHAKYIPRLVGEYFRHGIPRTILYELVDEFSNPTNKEANFGLLRQDLSPKPAFTALSSLLNLLKDPGESSFVPGTLSYSISALPAGTFTRIKYVHDLLLQKHDGTYYLLFWHEISDSSFTDESGNPIKTTARDLNPPPLTTTITLPVQVRSAVLYTYDDSWHLVPRPVEIKNGEITVAAGDTISALKFAAAPSRVR